MSALVPVLNWFAPAATMLAAMMTAANLGARVTGWGFAIFLIASLAWTALGIAEGPASLIYANTFLIIVNAFGVWRWLGRQTAYDEGAAAAATKSLREHVPTLFSFNSLIGAKAADKHGKAVGTIVDVMGKCESRDITYFVISEGGVGGVGERLHAISACNFDLRDDKAVIGIDADDLKTRPVLRPGEWPTQI